jgi:seryl-tRNA synthetase
MDTVIDRLMDNHAKNTVDIYNDMEKRRQESQADIKELHSRITTVDRNLSDKIELTERRIMEEIKNLKREIVSHNQKEDSELKRILEWKWMVMGAVGLFVWIISNFDKVSAIFH